MATLNLNLNATDPTAPTSHQNILFAAHGMNVTAYDPNFAGDAGSGGTAGNVPAPSTGDAAAGKFLKADGTWALPNHLVNAGVAAGSYADLLTLTAGSGASLTTLTLGAATNATANGKFAYLWAGDLSNQRALSLNGSGNGYFAPVLIGTNAWDANCGLQIAAITHVTGSATFTGGFNTGVRAVSAADTATTSDHTLICTTSAAFTETLPATPGNGQELYLVNVGSNVLTVAGNGHNIWAAGSTSASITLAGNATAILQFDYLAAVWRQIK